MAIGIKRSSTGQSFLNRPVRVTQIASQGEKKYAQQAEILGSVGEAFFALEKSRQVKAGKEFAQKLQVRDEFGNIAYKDPPASLGAFGYETATQEINKKYAVALKNQTNETAVQLRAQFPDEESFTANYGAWMEETAKNLEADGGAAVASAFIDDAGYVRSQHVTDIKSKRFQEEQDFARSQYDMDMMNSIAHMNTAYAAGDDAEGDALRNLIEESLDSDAMSIFNMTASRRNEVTNHLSDGRRDSILQNALGNRSAAFIRSVESAVETGDISDKLKAELPFLEGLISQSAAPGTPRGRTLNTFLSGLREAKSAQEAAAKQSVLAQDLMNARKKGFVPENDEKARDALDTVLNENGVDTDNIFSSEAHKLVVGMAVQAPFASNVLKRGFANLKGAGVYQPEDVARAVNVYRNITQEQTGTQYGLDQSTNEFMVRLNSLMQLKGRDPLLALDMAKRIPKNNPEDSYAVQQFTGFSTDSGRPMVDIELMAERYIRENHPDIRPGHIKRMTGLASALMITDQSGVDTILEETYNNKFPESKYIVTSSYDRKSGRPARSNHAPEMYLSKEQLKTFDKQASTLLLQYTSTEPLELGKNVFLDVVLGSDNLAQYKFVDTYGTPIRDVNGKEPIFGAKNIQEFQSATAIKLARDAELMRQTYLATRSNKAQARRAKARKNLGEKTASEGEGFLQTLAAQEANRRQGIADLTTNMADLFPKGKGTTRGPRNR